MTRSVLSNCYVPITCRDESTSTSSSLTGIHINKPFRCRTQQEASVVSDNDDDKNVQPSTRTRETLRPLVLETSWVLSSTLSTVASLSTSSPVVGSSLVEWGLTKVIAQLSLITDGSCLVDTGTLVVRVDATLPARLTSGRLFDGSITDGVKVSSRTGNHSTATTMSNALSLELESQIHRAILPSLNLKLYPKTILQLDLTLIQNDGSVLSACILASTLALADAQIELYDLVTCCQSVIIKDNQNDDYTIDNVWVDPESIEEHYSTSNVSLAILGQTQEVTFWRQQQQQQQETSVSKVELQTKEPKIDQTRTLSTNHMLNEEAIRLCRDGCRTLYKFVKQHLREKEEERCHQRQEKR
jgi:exosome complex component MTR3